MTSRQQVDEVAQAGGRLIVMPHGDAKVVVEAKALGLTALPGFSTPTEAFAMLEAGADGLKLFPAEANPPKVLKALRAVLPNAVPIIPVGSISVENMGEYWAAGANGFGLGSALYKPGLPPRRSARARPSSARRCSCWLLLRKAEPQQSAEKTNTRIWTATDTVALSICRLATLLPTLVSTMRGERERCGESALAVLGVLASWRPTQVFLDASPAQARSRFSLRSLASLRPICLCTSWRLGGQYSGIRAVHRQQGSLIEIVQTAARETLAREAQRGSERPPVPVSANAHWAWRHSSARASERPSDSAEASRARLEVGRTRLGGRAQPVGSGGGAAHRHTGGVSQGGLLGG